MQRIYNTVNLPFIGEISGYFCVVQNKTKTPHETPLYVFLQ